MISAGKVRIVPIALRRVREQRIKAEDERGVVEEDARILGAWSH